MNSRIEQLERITYNGARKKNLPNNDMVLNRLAYELSIIERNDFSDYFILYSKIVEVSNDLSILRSFGRGSAPNSLVNYCLDITNINPISENLIFEKFILPHQKSLPDIDLDIPKGYQRIIIEALKQKYPEYNSYFIAFIPNRALDCDNLIINEISYKKHPSGIIITTESLIDSIFSYNEDTYYLVNDTATNSFYNNKIDLVELKYLTKLMEISKETDEEYHPYSLPLDDKMIFNLFTIGDLKHIFQFSDIPIKAILQEFKPDSIHDLALINAMYRPGMMNFIPTVIEHKLHPEKRFKFSDNRINEFMAETYGIPIYQETILRIAKEIAGIPFEEAEIFRRKILRDKSNHELLKFINAFDKGCKEHSTLDDIENTSLINLIVEMLPIAFQKTHSLSYSIIGYWGAYYKTYFRDQFDKVFNNSE